MNCSCGRPTKRFIGDPSCPCCLEQPRSCSCSEDGTVDMCRKHDENLRNAANTEQSPSPLARAVEEPDDARPAGRIPDLNRADNPFAAFFNWLTGGQ